MSGGGGSKDGGASARSQEDRERKQRATEYVNAIFGIGPSSAKPNPASRESIDHDIGGYRVSKKARNRAWDQKIDESRKASEYAPVWDDLTRTSAANRTARGSTYDKNRTDVYDFNRSKLNEDFSKSDRELRFALSRAGLSGGSVDIDDNDKQDLAYDKGALTARSMGDESAAKFRTADEASRLDIINQIQSGVDSGAAISSAQRGLELSADRANASTRGNAIGNVFADIGLLYDVRQRDQGAVDARKRYAEQFGAFTPNTSTYSGTQRR